MKKSVILLFVTLCFIPLTIAFENDEIPLIAQQNYPYDLKVPCQVNNGYCNTSTLCNISIIYPNSSYLINNLRSSFSGQHFNFSLNSQQTNVNGRYLFTQKCVHGFYNDTVSGILYITPSGKLLTDGENWILLGSVMLLVFISLVFLLMALFVPPGAVKLFVFALGILMLIGSSMLTTNLLQNYVVNNSSIVKAMEYVFLLLAYLTAAVFIFSFVLIAIKVIQTLKDKARFIE